MAPKPTINAVEYPPECKEVSTELSKDELHRRLKQLAKVMQDIGQDDEHEKYSGLALHMASDEFLTHESKDVKLVIACILADIFRIFAPNHPFGNTEKLKSILKFLISQLEGLGSPDSHNYKRYYYLLENLTYAKTFTVCLDWETDEIVLHLLNTVFGSLTSKHTDKVLSLLLDAVSSVLSEADNVSIAVLDAIFVNIVEPNKSICKEAYTLAKDVLRRNSAALASSIMNFFNQTMMLGNSSESEVGEKLMDVLYELYQISPTLVTSLIPFLDQKLKVNEVSERKSVIRLLGRLFADADSDLMETAPELWQSYLGRYHDIETEIRVLCIEQAEAILTNHPSAKAAISEHWNRRHRDADDNVRCAVVQAIVNTCKKGLQYVTEEMLQCVRERCLDKKFKIRKEALTGLGAIFRKYAINDDGSIADFEGQHKIPIQWIQNRILQTYFQRLLDDKFMVERIFLQCIVPYTLSSEDRMRRLLTMYAYNDENSRKAFSTMLKAQTQLRKLVKELVDLCGSEEDSPKLVHQVSEQAVRISKHYPDSGNKVAEGLKKFFVSLINDTKSRELMDAILHPKCSCEDASEKSRALQSRQSAASVPSGQLMAVKVLLERIAPLLIDQEAVDILVQYVCDCLTNSCDFMDSFSTPYEDGMSLLVCIAPEYPQAFDSERTFNNLTEFLKHENDTVSSAALQILMNTGSTLKEKFPDTCDHLLQTLQSMVKIGSPRQAKHAVRCLATMFDNKEDLFNQIAKHCEENLSMESANICTSLVALGHMALLAPKAEFVSNLKPIVQHILIKQIMMLDKNTARSGRRATELWTPDHMLTEETQAKIQAMKMMVRWLHAIQHSDNAEKYCTSTLRMLERMLTTQGDLVETKRILRGEMARLRLSAALCILKIVHIGSYAEMVSNEVFQNVALVINDPVLQVRIAFTQKLHKYLLAMKIPLQYMSIFALCANDRVKDRKQTVKQYIELNIQKRREYLRKHPATNNRVLFSILPDYVIPYAVHLLAHDPELESWEDAPNLRNIKECLWLLLEPLMKDQASFYSFQKKIFEYIKQTKDAQSPDNDVANKKMWAVCDLGIQIIMQRCPFNSKAVPCGTPLLPAKLFTGLDKSNSNKDTYLPRDLVYIPSRGSANKTDYFPPGSDRKSMGNSVSGDSDSAVDVKVKKNPGDDDFINPEEDMDAEQSTSDVPEKSADKPVEPTSPKKAAGGTKRKAVEESAAAADPSDDKADDAVPEVMTKKQRAAKAAAQNGSGDTGAAGDGPTAEAKATETVAADDEPVKKATRASARRK